jgi:hypothetical protein
MAKTDTEISKTCDCNCNSRLSVINGFRFGFGFFLANLVGVLIIGVITWIIVIIASHYGLVF